MYLPEGKVMPAYSTWQPTEGKIPPTASADQSATRRLVAPRGDPMRGNPIASTLLASSTVPLTHSWRELDRRGESWFDPAQPDATILPSGTAVPVIWRGPGLLGRTVRSSGFLFGYQI